MAVLETIGLNLLSNAVFEAGKAGAGILSDRFIARLGREDFRNHFMQIADSTWQYLRHTHPVYAEPGCLWVKEVLADCGLHHWWWDRYLQGQPLDRDSFRNEVAALFRARFSADFLAQMAQELDFGDHLHAAFQAAFRAQNPEIAVVFALDRIEAGQNEDVIPLLKEILANLQPTAKGSIQQEGKALWGRIGQRNQALLALKKGQPIQIVGETLMGKTTFLNWLQHNASWPSCPMVWISAENLPLKTPAELVQKIADRLGDPDWARAALGAGDARTASHTLAQLIDRHNGLVLLLDDAHKLAAPGHGFTHDFFDLCRTRTELTCRDARLVFVAATKSRLYPLFQQYGLTSSFLNNACDIRLPVMSHADMADLPVSPDPIRELMWEISGGFPGGLEWLLSRYQSQQWADRNQLEDDYLDQFGQVFAGWTDQQGDQTDFLKRCLVDKRVDSLGDAERANARGLVKRGFLVERDGHFLVLGAAWRRFLGER